MPKDSRQLFVKVLAIFGSVVLFSAQLAMAAGSGTLKGRVFDKDTKEALPGATVLVKGTSIGASTDLNGDFVIHNAPAGEQTIVVSYVGYHSSDEKVDIPDNQILQEDFYLSATAVQGKVVIVTAQAQGQIQAINQQLASNKIANIVSAAKIQELPDFNAAQAISRLPGVSVLQSSGEADKVVIRGLAPQYNEIAVGGVTLASTGSAQIGATSQGGTSGSISNDRSVDLTMVTPYMVKSIEVYKTLTPDMNADAIGGYVNMELREAPSGLHGDALWQSGYTQKDNSYGNYRAIASASDRFFDDNLGAYFLFDAESYDRNADNMSAAYSTYSSIVDTTTGYRPVQVNSVTLDRHIETRKRYGANLILDYRLPNGFLKSTNMFSRLNSNYQDNNVGIDYQGNGINFTYRAGDGTTDLGVNTLEFQNDFGFMSADINAAYTYSRNYLPSSPFYQFRQTGGVVVNPLQTINVVPDSLATTVNYLGSANTYLTSISLLSSDYKEYDKVIRGDFKIPLNVGSTVSGFIKFGGEYRGGDHTNNQHTPYTNIDRGSPIQVQMSDSILAQSWGGSLKYDSLANGKFPASNFTSNNSSLYNSFLSNDFGRIYWAANPTLLNDITSYVQGQPELSSINAYYNGGASNAGGWTDGGFQTLPNNYMYYENYYAGYAMSELDLGSDAMVVGGVRYEQVTSDFTAYNLRDSRSPATQPAFVQEVTVHPGNKFWLPQVQAKYDIADWADLRYSYTQTLSRPDYSELSPHYNIGYGGGPVWSGNPNLRPAHAYNHDLELTLHSNVLGLLSIGGFYKEIKDFTYPTSYHLYNPGPGIVIPPGLDSIGTFAGLGSPPTPGTTLYTYVNNRYIAYVKGIETDLQTRFWYLPFPLNGLLIGINYTHIWSQTQYPLENLVTSGRPPNQTHTLIDSTRSGRLIYQPNDIMNTYLGYDFKGFSARVSFVFQGNSVSYVGSFPEQDGFSKNYFRIDFSARQMLPWTGLQLYVDANNLNSEPNISAQTSIGGFTSEQYYGLTADLGIRLTL
jgi:TonB-dependent receptor